MLWLSHWLLFTPQQTPRGRCFFQVFTLYNFTNGQLRHTEIKQFMFKWLYYSQESRPLSHFDVNWEKGDIAKGLSL